MQSDPGVNAARPKGKAVPEKDIFHISARKKEIV
jgi:hypothetical protein